MTSDGLQASATGSGLAEHRSSRVYLRQSLRSLLALFKDFPGLLGPKAIVINPHPDPFPHATIAHLSWFLVIVVWP